jgi:hypothetical protein
MKNMMSGIGRAARIGSGVGVAAAKMAPRVKMTPLLMKAIKQSPAGVMPKMLQRLQTERKRRIIA